MHERRTGCDAQHSLNTNTADSRFAKEISVISASRQPPAASSA
jgi:hypothetical protein